MPSPPLNRPCVPVAIALVVDKMSTQLFASCPSHPRTTSPDHSDSPLRLLITRRKADQVLGGYWELPGGKIEPTESPQDAVVRELYEEVGIHIQPIAQLPSVEHHYDHAHVRLIPFICQHLAGTPAPLQVDDLRWVTPQALADYRFPDATLPVIAALHHWLNTHQPADNTPAPDLADAPQPQA